MEEINRKAITKKGQIEMFGLAVIVILISLGFFIYLSVKSNEEVNNPKQEFTYDKTADDFVLAILHVSIEECPEFTVNDLIIDCARDNRLKCNGASSCLALNRSVNMMLNETFMEYNTKFRFYSQGLKYIDEDGRVAGELFDVSFNGCTADSNQGRSGKAVIPAYPAPSVFLNLNLCTR